MTPVESPARALAISMLELAVEDYVILREIGAVTGTVIDASRWRYEVNKRWRYSPNGYDRVVMVRELIEFLMGDHFEMLCDFVSTEENKWQAWQFRQRIGIVSGATRLLGSADLWWVVTPDSWNERRKKAVDGSRLAVMPVFNQGITEINAIAEDHHDEHEQTAA